MKEHQILVFTNGFSFEDKENESFLKKVSENYKDKSPNIINLALDQNLKNHVVELTKKQLPLLVEDGKIKEL